VISPRLTIAGLALALAACGDAPTDPVEQNPSVATILLGSPATTVDVGATLTLTAVARDAQGREVPGQAFVWQSSNASVATVVGGVVTGVAEGNVTLRASVGSVTSNAVPLSVTAVIQSSENSLTLIDDAVASAPTPVGSPEPSRGRSRPAARPTRPSSRVGC
jgi:hypothetical protein